MRYPTITITALASSLALLAATQLPAKAGPAFNLKSTRGMVELVKSGGGGGGGGGGHGGGVGHFGGGGGLGISGGRASMGHMGGGGGGGGGGGMGRMASSGGHMRGGGNGHMGRMARGGDFDNGSGRHGRVAGNNWNGNWNGNWDHNRNHHHHNRFITGYPFWYGGGYYAYNSYGNCAWLRRQAVVTGSPYWWRRYQECLY
jgi:hypothetical protein